MGYIFNAVKEKLAYAVDAIKEKMAYVVDTIKEKAAPTMFSTGLLSTTVLGVPGCQNVPEPRPIIHVTKHEADILRYQQELLSSTKGAGGHVQQGIFTLEKLNRNDHALIQKIQEGKELKDKIKDLEKRMEKATTKEMLLIKPEELKALRKELKDFDMVVQNVIKDKKKEEFKGKDLEELEKLEKAYERAIQGKSSLLYNKTDIDIFTRKLEILRQVKQEKQQGSYKYVDQENIQLKSSGLHQEKGQVFDPEFSDQEFDDLEQDDPERTGWTDPSNDNNERVSQIENTESEQNKTLFQELVNPKPGSFQEQEKQKRAANGEAERSK